MNENYDFKSVGRTGIALVVSGPSGAGKSTICEGLLKGDPRLSFSVSCATRKPRPGEIHGKDYYFMSVEQFRRHVDNGEMLEHAEVHGNFYGTLRSEVVDRVRKGEDVILDIDVQGALSLKSLTATDPELANAVELIFIAPPSVAELERRLRGRGTETEEAIARRIHNAVGELAKWSEYEYLLVNECSDNSIIEIKAIVSMLKLKTKRFKI